LLKGATVSNVVVAEDVVYPITPEFSWSAVFAGALAAVAVTFLLLFIGSGVGLSLVSVPQANAQTAQNAITLGAIYFFASQAFGFTVGGYLAGRLMGPVLENENEELFHATTHGLVVWALAVVATATVIAISGLVVFSSALNATAIVGAANQTNQWEASLTPAATGYWTDALFRPLANAPATASPTVSGQSEAKAQSGRILTIGVLHGERLSQDDHDQLARLISLSTGADMAEAARRVDDVQARIHQEEVATAEGARKLAKYVSIWLAASLCFGALVAAGAAVSGRWVDDKARAGV
jgi:hypothetical protein